MPTGTDLNYENIFFNGGVDTLISDITLSELFSTKLASVGAFIRELHHNFTTVFCNRLFSRKAYVFRNDLIDLVSVYFDANDVSGFFTITYSPKVDFLSQLKLCQFELITSTLENSLTQHKSLPMSKTVQRILESVPEIDGEKLSIAHFTSSNRNFHFVTITLTFLDNENESGLTIIIGAEE